MFAQNSNVMDRWCTEPRLLTLLRFGVPSILVTLAPETMVTTEEAAVILDVSEDHVRRLVREEKIPAKKRRNRYALRLADVLDARIGVLAEKGGE